jgi:hypothetical protein
LTVFRQPKLDLPSGLVQLDEALEGFGYLIFVRYLKFTDHAGAETFQIDVVQNVHVHVGVFAHVDDVVQGADPARVGLVYVTPVLQEQLDQLEKKVG